MATKKNKKTLFGICFTMLLSTVGFILPTTIPNKFYGINKGNGKIKQHFYNPMQKEQQPDSAKSNEVMEFYVPEVMPEFPGGKKALYKFLSDNIKYPESAKKKKIQGTVWVSFIIEKDGSISHIKVEHGISPELDKEAIRVIKSMPRWKPATLRGKPVRIVSLLPVKFSL